MGQIFFSVVFSWFMLEVSSVTSPLTSIMDIKDILKYANSSVFPVSSESRGFYWATLIYFFNSVMTVKPDVEGEPTEPV